jgi:N-methylhydantoinase B/oxoprolinase/acetone carboxylase alpha subunit
MGRDLVAQIVEDFGSARLRAAMLLRWDRSEQAVRTLIAGMPNGTYRAGSFLDDDRQAPGVPLPIEVAVIVADEAITVDLSSRPPQGRGPVNADCERGPGRWRGGLGVEKQCTILADCRIGTKVERARCRPWGVDGDQEGEVGRVVVCRDGAAPVTLLKGDVALQPGDRVEIYGGGRGYPARRDPEALRHDLAMAYVTQWPASAGEGSEA